MNEPTQQQKCADLARAMGWKWFTDDNPEHDGTMWLSTASLMAKTIRQYPTVHETEEILPIDWKCVDIPNPYESADDSRALVAWLAAHDDNWFNFRLELASMLSVSGNWPEEWLFERAAMIAPLPVIADAAWLVIQEKK